MLTERRVVDNRVFLLGLDKLYRDAMMQHERGELLGCARRVAETLRTKPADVPVEGYYADDEQLTEYFRLVRALQGVSEGARSAVDSLPEFQRLLAVTAAPLYGRAQHNGNLLPAGRDALSQALLDTRPWTAPGLTAAAYTAALKTDDISLVGLAARVRDAVVLTATRESVVLYAEIMVGSALGMRWHPIPRYVWNVDDDLARHARRFIETFKELFGDELPPPDPAQAERYWLAYDGNVILGRCVRIGYETAVAPTLYYHWGISRTPDGELVVEEFWDSEVWTTTRYRLALDRPGLRGREPSPELDGVSLDPPRRRRWWDLFAADDS